MKVVSFSGSTQVLSSAGARALKDVFKKNVVTLQLNVTYARPKLIRESDEVFERKLDTIRVLMAEGVIDGIDIAGSIHEGRYSEITNPSRLLGRMLQLSELVTSADSRGSGLLEIHAYEGARSGGFYRTLWRFLDCLGSFEAEKRRKQKTDLQSPNIVIGHIRALTKRDIDRFAVWQTQHPSVNLFFDANTRSNLLVQKADLGGLAARVAYMRRKGLVVGLGDDGQSALYPFEVSDQVDKQQTLPRFLDAAWEVDQLFSALTKKTWLRFVLGSSESYPTPKELVGYRSDVWEFTRSPRRLFKGK